MKKAGLRIVIVIFTLIGASFAVNVVISSPANGATVGSPVAIDASASSSSIIVGWQVYVDNNIAYTAGVTSAIAAPVTMSAGSHNVVVSAWDSSGATGSASVVLNGGTNAAASSGPQPPANASAFTHMEQMSGWNKCSAPSCSGGVGTAYNYYMAPYQTSPSLSGSSTAFYIDGAPYVDDLFGILVTTNPNFTNFMADFWVYTDANTPSLAQALEFDTIQVSNYRKYVWGSECNYATKTWDTWNEVTQTWIHSNAACTPFTPNAWHHIQWQLARAGAQTNYIAITVDGVTQAINSAYAYQPAPVTNWTNGAVLFQVQQDLNATGGAYQIFVDSATLYAWQ